MGYHGYKLLFRLLTFIPWWLLEFISRCIAVSLHRVLCYRRAVVYDNLRRSFPECSPKETEAIARDFYCHLVYQLISAPKLLSQSEADIRQRHLLLEGLEVFEELGLDRRKVCIVMMGHCGNWELFSAGQVYFGPLGYQQEQLYRPLSNEALDRVQREMRSRYGSLTTPKADIGRRIIQLLRREVERPHILAFIADQTPRPSVSKVWAHFLGRPTAFLDGAERLARKYDLPVVYMDVEYLGPSKYRGRMQLISSTPRMTAEGEITLKYVALLEQTIRRAPAYWLWSHKRWKFTPQA